MNSRLIRFLKPLVFVLCLVPLFGMIYAFRRDTLGSDPVATLTHWTGNWAVYFLLGSLAVSPVRRLSTKLAWLVRFRRMIGLFAFFYATLHLMTYVFLFSGFDLPGALDNLKASQFAAIGQKWKDVWPTMLDDVQKRRFIQVGLLSWVILLALAATSPQWIMRKMGGRAWQTLHKTVYAAAVLAIIHYWWLVKKGNMEPLRDTIALLVLLAARPVWTWWDTRRKAARLEPVLRTQ